MIKKGGNGIVACMGNNGFFFAVLSACIVFLVSSCPVLAAESSANESKTDNSKALNLPYAFYNDSFGVAVGYVYGVNGFPQPQATTIATVIAGSNSSAALFLLTRDIRAPYTQRLFFDTDLAVTTYGTIQSYISGNPDFPNERAGSNNSDKENYVDGDGSDNLVRVNFKYLLPLGSGRDMKMVKPPELVRGLPREGSDQGLSWNPLVSGRTFIEVKPYWRDQNIHSDYGTFDQKTNGAAFSLYRDNTDFPRNPSDGSTLRLRYTQDWGLYDSSRPYYVGDFEFSKYVSLGSTDRYRQRVLAFDVWTSDAYSWNRTSMEDHQEVYQRPPAYLGSTLGGLWRMRGYPTSRFNDQAAIYYAAEYRLIPEWNPFINIGWLQKRAGIEWWQWVAFMEAGRVAPVWTLGELHSSMKYDAGIGVRAMAKGIVVRVDLAGSREGFEINMMVNQPFQF